MSRRSSRSLFWQGLRDGAPFIMVIAPFALLFGVVGTEAGLALSEVMGFSLLVLAGAAQFTAVQLLGDGAPAIVALVSALAVNLRMAMYSASLTPYLGAAPFWRRALAAYFLVDQTYSVSYLAYETNPEWSVAERMSYYFGVVIPVCPPWYLFTYLGAAVGDTIPDSFALDFALPITFLAMIGPMLRTPAHMAAALVAAVTALVAAGLPYNTGLLLAGLLGMTTGARIETWLERRKAGRRT